jgi:hypothetical protein
MLGHPGPERWWCLTLPNAPHSLTETKPYLCGLTNLCPFWTGTQYDTRAVMASGLSQSTRLGLKPLGCQEWLLLWCLMVTLMGARMNRLVEGNGMNVLFSYAYQSWWPSVVKASASWPGGQRFNTSSSHQCHFISHQFVEVFFSHFTNLPSLENLLDRCWLWKYCTLPFPSAWAHITLYFDVSVQSFKEEISKLRHTPCAWMQKWERFRPPLSRNDLKYFVFFTFSIFSL